MQFALITPYFPIYIVQKIFNDIQATGEIHSMETIPILSNLTNEQFDSLLSICTKQVLPGYTVICKEGDKSDDMFILTDGMLKVVVKGVDVGRILPISTVGEMGLFTGETRSATIFTSTKCTLLRIMKNDLLDLFEKDKDFHIKFQEGMLIDLSTKIRMTNEAIAKRKSRFKITP